MPDFIYGGFEWNRAKALRNRRDHGISFNRSNECIL
jgi:uncharacterized DUF497 family protein